MFKKMIGWLFMGSILLGTNEAAALSRPAAKPTVIILLGPPGVGKGTHAAPLSDAVALPQISTGDLFREQIRSQSPLGKLAQSYMDQGKLVPDELVLEMLFERLNAEDCRHGCILDGFPRTLAQAQSLDARLANRSSVIVLNFFASDSVLVERISGRLICRDCKKSFHKQFDPPRNQRRCDVCDGELFTREDDQKNIVKKRLDVYRTQTMPLIAYYADKKGILKEINGENNKEQIFQDVLDALPVFSKPPLR